MGSSTETIRNLQVVGIMDKYGGLNKSLFIGEAQQIPAGMPVVREQRQTDIIMIKSMYNEGYLDAMGYDPVSKIKVKDINKSQLLQYTKNHIDSSAVKILTATIRPVSIIDTIKKTIQTRVGYDAITLSYLDGSTRVYFHDAVDTGNYIEAVYYESIPMVDVTNYLDNKYIDGVNKLSYEIVRMGNLATIIDGELKYTVRVKYTYKQTTIINGQPYEEIVTDYADEYFVATLRYEELEDTSYTTLKDIVNAFTKPVSYYGCTSTSIVDSSTCVTVTGQQTAVLDTNEDSISLQFSFNNPYSRITKEYRAWEILQAQYQEQQNELLNLTMETSVRKIVWEYETPLGNRYLAFEIVQNIPNLIQDKITEVYPIIPIKEHLSMVKDTIQTRLVLGKIGMKRDDLIDSVINPDIRSSFLVFGVLPNDKSPECLMYLYEYFHILGNSTSTDIYGSGITEVTVIVEYLYKSAAGVKQTYLLGFQSHTVEEGAPVKPINSYWYESYNVQYISHYETVYNESGVGSTQVPVYWGYNVHSYCKQVTTTQYNRIIIYNIHAITTTSGYTFKTSLLYRTRGSEDSAGANIYTDKGKDWDIRIPIVRDITNIMRFDYLCHVIERSMALLIFTQVEVKVSWYQQPWVTMVLFAVAAWTGQYYVVAAMTASTMATVVVVAGVAMAASTALLIGVTMLTLTMLSMMGIDLGIFGVIASVALVFMGGYAMLSSTNTLVIGMRQVVMLATQVAKIASQVNSFFFNKNIKELAKEQARALSQQNQELEKYQKESDQLLENTIPGGINMFGSEIPSIDDYYTLAYDDFDQYEMMYNYAVDYDSMFKTV